MSRLSSEDLLAHTQEYVHAVFADLLRQEGFTSPDGKDTIWYRIVNHEVVNTICFYTLHLAEPVVLHMGYGIHPLFVEPFCTKSVYVHNFPYNYEVLHDHDLVSKDGPGGLRFFAPDLPVMIPHGQDKGLYTLEGIALPKMNAVQTALDCYKLHKERYLEETPYTKKFNITFEQRLNGCSVDFVNEGILWEDTELYPHFQHLVTERLRQFEDYDEKLRCSKWAKTRLFHLEHQRSALFENERSAFLASLAQQRKKIVDLIEKQFQIDV